MNASYRIGWLLFRALYATYFRWRVFGAENVPLSGGVILASNHASFLDPPLVGSGLNRDINYLARESLFRFPGIGALLRSWNAVPVDRDGGGAAGLREILNRLLAGGAIILFPEGTRTRDGKLQPARSGIGLTVQAGARFDWALGDQPNQIVITVKPTRRQLLERVRQIGRTFKKKGQEPIADLVREREEEDRFRGEELR